MVNKKSVRTLVSGKTNISALFAKNSPVLSHADDSLEESRAKLTQSSQRAALIAEHEAKTQESSLRRNAEIGAAKERHLLFVKGLDEKLEIDLRELDAKQSESHHGLRGFRSVQERHDDSFTEREQRGCAFGLRKPKGIRLAHEKKFVPFRLPAAKPRDVSEEPTLPDSQATISTVSDDIYDNSSLRLGSSPSFEPSSSSPLTPTQGFAKSFTEDSPSVSKKRKTSTISSPSKKSRVEETLSTSTTDSIPAYIELDPIRPKLLSYPFCFISAWNIDIRDENLRFLRKMVEERFFYPEAVRADKTGYFLIFEASEKGESAAEKCGVYFRKWKFRKQHMHMVFCKRGSAVDGL